MRILLVEDDEDDIVRVRRLLMTSADIELVTARSLKEARETIGRSDIDAMLLDLSLPDSAGVESLGRLRSSHAHLPVVILTEINEEALGLEALNAGAQDFLVKDHLTAPLLLRSLRYALERQRVLSSLSDLTHEEGRLREVYALERLAGGDPTVVTARTFELRSLSEAAPGPYDEFKRRYDAILSDAIDASVFKVEHGIAKQLQELADDVGRYRGGPRDIVQIHLEVLQSRMKGESAERAKSYLEEGRLLVLEFMGQLAAFYRGYFFGR